MTSIMNTNYKIISNISLFEDRKIKSSLKTATLMNNNTMNNDYRTCTLDPPVQHKSSESPRMRRFVMSAKY